ncbi:exodeoxyribonuclease V subunit alpha [Photobacterium makurazakiensis]|uniref:exodeoxyribonuclease V subunit alpha n=1 Tax=Photobacterium makurazakiensis TaxID=2910234 RepID=UPI003D0B2139
MLNRLEQLTRQGRLRPLDYQFAKFVAMTSNSGDNNEQDSLVTLVAALASHELGQGHVCVSLQHIDTCRLFGLSPELSGQLQQDIPDVTHWQAILQRSVAVSDGSCPTPLVVDNQRVYLSRYWQFEQMVAGHLKRSSHTHQMTEIGTDVMAAKLDELFARSYTFLFQSLQKLKKEPLDNTVQARQIEVCDKLDIVAADSLDWPAIDQVLVAAEHISDLDTLASLIPNSVCLNWQKVAAAVALTRQFAVISGGPGTGKTTTVAKLLAALVTQAIQSGELDEQGQPCLPDIKLVAPTGKAAARLTESIGAAVDSLAVEKVVKDNIPTQSSTLHRLLGSIPNRVAFRHNRENPLHLDVLVVDEASMVDLPMMARLLDAMPPHAKLILLGDRDQLASVEAGAVLGDICSFSDQGYSQQQSQLLGQLTGFQFAALQENLGVVADSLCMLRKSYRFHAQSGIGQLAKAINAGQPRLVEKVLQQGFKDIHHYPLNSESYQSMLNMAVTFYRGYLDAIEAKSPPAEVLKAFSQIRLLCALREGDFGVVGLNQRIERGLARLGKIAPDDETWYVGRPIMISQNDHGLGLYNGDIGIAMKDPEPDAQTGEYRTRVFFEMPDGSIRGVLPSRLPEHETVYAMTIHKSQGSEFADTLMVLPTEFSPLLTRELTYTGITRAKEKLYLFATQDTLNRSVRLRTERASGLADLLN